MADYHVVLGMLALALQPLGVALYISSTFWKGTKPHPFTWFTFSVVDGTIFAAQLLHGGGPGAWLLGVTTFTSSLIFAVALWKGERRIARIDWIFLALALVGIAAWNATGNALYAVVLASFVELIAKVPTFRKAFLRPDEESVTIWSVGFVNFSLSIAALTTKSLITVLFPLVIVASNGALIAVILLRRRQLAARTKTG